VRLLSNFETTSQKLMQILLVGQPELRDKLNTPELRQLKQRIGLRCHIGPLSPEETRLYIRHRLRIAGASDAGIFTDAAIQRITEYSQGIPRVVNIVCDHCLLSGFADSKRRIDTGVVDEAVEYLEEGERRSGSAAVRSAWCRHRGVVWARARRRRRPRRPVLLLLVFAVNTTAGRSAMRVP
jgi:general secretion pathway protein A